MKPEYPVAHTPNVEGCWHSLEEHLGDVAAQARSYADKFNAGELAYFAGLWHDLGKYNPQFQQYLEQCAIATENNQQIASVPHAKHGAKFAWEVFMPLAPPSC